MKTLILSLSILFTVPLTAQVYQNSKFWSAALNVGGQALVLPSVESVKFYQPSLIHVNAAYKFNHIYGVRPSVNFHRLIMDEASFTDAHTKYVNASLDFFVDFNQMGTYGFRENQWEWSVLGYTGFGFSTMWRDKSNHTLEDPLFKGQDDMISLSIGITPRIRISRNMLLNVDLSWISHIFQDRTYDMGPIRLDRGFGGGMTRFSFGLTYEFIK